MRESLRRHAAAAVAVLLGPAGLAGLAPAAQETPAVTLNIQVDPQAVAVARFVGFGAEWDPYYWQPAPPPPEHWKRIEQRLAWIRPPVVRMMVQARWCYDSGRYDWQSPPMQALYRNLELCRKYGAGVFLTDWGVESWAPCPGIKGVDDPLYADVIATYLDRLLRKDGYSCIRWFILTNEPNYEAKSGYEAWRQGVRNVAKALAARGLDKLVTQAGSDAVNDMSWHRRAVDDLAGIFGVYDIHGYIPRKTVRAGGLEDFFRQQRQYVLDHDPRGKGKPFIAAEAGMQDGMEGAHANHNIDTFGYGVFMADYAVQATRAGMGGAVAWMLDDNSHKGFTWGLWTDSSHGLKLRPWFYPWSLVCRFVPGGSTVFGVESGSPDVRVLAARAPAAAASRPTRAERESGDEKAQARGTSEGAAAGGWTFIIVNRGQAAVRATLTAPAPAGPYRRYLYASGAASADADGLPTPAETLAAEPAKGVKLSCPPDSVTVLTNVRR